MASIIQIEQIAHGWYAKSVINWEIVNESMLDEYLGQVKEGIRKTTQNLGLDFPKSEVLNSIKVVLLDTNVFGELGVILYDEKDSMNIQKIIENNCSSTVISQLYSKFNGIPGNRDYSKEACRDFYSKDQAFAVKNYIIINKGLASKELGLHLLCHEIMHLLASPQKVIELRKNDRFGDEATNEFVARVISFDNDFGGTNLQFNSSSDSLHNEHGVYGSLLDKEKFDSKTQEQVIEIFKDYLNLN